VETLLSIQAGILRMPVLILKGSAASEPRSATTKAQAINAGAAVEAARRIVDLESKPQQEIDLGQHYRRSREYLYQTAL
jgi:predicted Rossmann-fold nucleotide-binding protein